MMLRPSYYIALVVAMVAFLAGRYSVGSRENLSAGASVHSIPAHGKPVPIIKFKSPESQQHAVPDSERNSPESRRTIPTYEEVRNERIQKRSAEHDSEYRSLLSGWGLSPDEVDKTIRNLDQIFGLSVTAGDSRMELVQARQRFDKEMQGMLGPEKHKEYRDYEDAKSASRELAAIRDYVGKNGRSIDVVEMPMLEKAIRESGAYSSEYYGGPYDPLPHPNVGREGGEDVSRQLEQLKSRLGALFSGLEGVASDDALASVKAYYEDRVAGLDRVTRIMLADPKTQAEMLAAIREKHHMEILARVEAELAAQAAVNARLKKPAP